MFFCFLFTSSAFSFECNEERAKKILTDYQWYSEDYPPYNYKNKQGKLVGIYPDILMQVSEELDINIKLEDVVIVPWARLFYTLENSLEHAAFTMI